MSKSYDNVIEIFADERALKKKIMGIKTDSTPVEAPKPIEGSVILDLFRLVAKPSEFEAMRADFLSGGCGYGDFKKRLLAAVWNYFEPMRHRRAELEAHPGHVEEVLKDGARRAAAVAAPVMERVREAVGLAGCGK